MSSFHMLRGQIFPMKEILFTIFLLFLSIFSSGQEVRIGIITDIEEGQERLNILKVQLQEEVQKTLGSSISVVIQDQDIKAANWNVQTISSAYLSLAERCDFIVLAGALSAKTVLNSGSITKPTLAIGISNVEIQEIPITDQETSGATNFSYVLISRDLETELTQFRNLVEFNKLAVLVHGKGLLSINEQKAQTELRRLATQFGCEINVVPIGDNVEQSLNQIPSGTDAAIVLSTYEMDDPKVKAIADNLIDRSLPSYALLKNHVELGILSSVSGDNSLQTLIRKLAIMMDDIRGGTAVADLPVTLNIKKQLYFNLETSQAINYSTSFQTLFSANLINEDLANDVPTYTLAKIFERALEENLGIQITEKDVDLATQDVKLANSAYLPTAEISILGTQVNEGSTSPIFGQSQRTLTESISLSQVLFSESLLANIRISKFLREAQEHDTQQITNDIILNVYQAYFGVLLAQTNVTIQRENLELLKKNLELAQLQQKIGASNKADVFRWESEVANATQAIIEGQSSLIVAKQQLNFLLNNTLEEEFKVQDVSARDDLFNFFDNNILARDIKGPDDVKKVVDFLVAEAKRNFPLRQVITSNINAVERQLKSNKRTYYLPTMALSAQQQEIIDRGGLASTETANSNFFNSTWNVGINLSYPIFDGNRRHINLQTTKIQQNQLRLQLADFDNGLDFDLTSIMIDVVTSRTNLNFSRISSESSWKNFQLIQDFYRQGSVSVVQLFDAQNAALQAKLAYNNSVYLFLLSFVMLENNIGHYSMLATPESQSAYEQRYLDFKSGAADN